MQRKLVGPLPPSEDAFHRYYEQLKNPDRGIAVRAVESISRLGIPAVPHILSKIESFNSEQTSEGFMAAADLIWSLVLIGDASAAVGLGKYTESSNEVGVRTFAEWATKRLTTSPPTLEHASADIKSSGFFKPLLGALDLDLLGTPDTVKPLLEACGDMGEKRQYLRGIAAWSLRRHLGEEGVRDKLTYMISNDPDREVQQISREARKGIPVFKLILFRPGPKQNGIDLK